MQNLGLIMFEAGLIEKAPESGFGKGINVRKKKKSPTDKYKGQKTRKKHKAVVEADPICRYCMERPSTSADHVIPPGQGGTDAWMNLVGACDPCNQFKADRTPEQAGMILHKPDRMLNPEQGGVFNGSHTASE